MTLKGHSGLVDSVEFSSNEKWLASGSYDYTVKLWNVSTGACQSTLNERSNVVFSIAFLPDGEFLASGSDNHTVKLWDLSTGACQARSKLPLLSSAYLGCEICRRDKISRFIRYKAARDLPISYLLDITCREWAVR